MKVIYITAVLVSVIFDCFAQDTIKTKYFDYFISKNECNNFIVFKSNNNYKQIDTLGSFEPIISTDSTILGYVFKDLYNVPNFPFFEQRRGEILAIVNFKIGIPINLTNFNANFNDDSIKLKQITTYTEFIFPNTFLKSQIKGRLSRESILKIIYNGFYDFFTVGTTNATYKFSHDSCTSFAKKFPVKYTNFVKAFEYKMIESSLNSKKISFQKIAYYRQHNFITELERFIYVPKILHLSEFKFNNMYTNPNEQSNFELKVAKDWYKIANSDGIDEILAKYLK